MAAARPLHELLTELTGDGGAARAQGDPEAYLAANGHSDLPPDLVAEAVVSYADTAPVEVAEHLQPYVTTHSAVPTDEPPAEDWYELLSTAPAETPDIDDSPDSDLDTWSPEDEVDVDPGPGLDFGTGSADALDAPSTLDATDEPSRDEPAPAEQADQTPASAWTDLEPENVDLDAVAPADDTDDPDTTGDLD